MNRWRALGLTTTLLAISACADRGNTDQATRNVIGETVNGAAQTAVLSTSFAPYETFGDCTDFLEWTKAMLLERVGPYGVDVYGWGPERWADEPAAFPSDGDASVATEAPAEWEQPVEEPAATDAPSADAFNPAPADIEQPSVNGGTSTTNTQEQGVDEGDVSETDGRFVYSIIDSTLRSIDLETSTLLTETEVPLNGATPQMILFGSSLLVAWPEWSNNIPATAVRTYALVDGVPSFVATSYLEGSMLSLRSVEGVARATMTSSLLDRITFVHPRQSYNRNSEQDALAINQQIINELTVDALLPRRYARAADGTRGAVEQALDCELVGHPGQFAGFGVTWVASVDLTNPTASPLGSGGIVADGQTVYVSPQHLYLAGLNNQWPTVVDGEAVISSEPLDPTTTIHSFDISDPMRTTYLASGEVGGTLLNSYSMSEFNGHLRVATTESNSGFGGGQDSGVHVLHEQLGELVEVGAVRGMGEDEEIQAVRFFGDVGYVVTFRQTDPLYVIDLSNPTQPKLAGELKIHGYSSYLHPIGDGLLLGVGFSGDDNGLTGGTKLSLFDVSDPTNPIEIAETELVGTTEAAFDPHAFLWWPETSDVVVPQEMVCQIGQRDECSTAAVVHVDIAQRTMTETAALFQWFPVRRTMVADGDLVTLSAGGLKRWSFTDFSELADIRFDIPGTTAEDTLP